MSQDESLKAEVNKQCSALITRVEKIFSKDQKFTKSDFMKLHNNIHEYFAHQKDLSSMDQDYEWILKSRKFFEKLGEFLRNQVHHIFAVGKDETDADEGETDAGGVLRFYAREWNEYQRKAKMLDHACCHAYNRVRWGKKVPERSNIIYKLAVTCWRDHQFCTWVAKAILKLINRERIGVESPDIHLIKDVIKCFTEDAGNIYMDEEFSSASLVLPYSSMWWSSVDNNLSVYRDTFEFQFLEDTALFYVNKRTQFLRYLNLNSSSFTGYRKFVEEITLQVENERVRMYLPESTREKSMSIWYDTLIIKHLDTFLQKFSFFLVANDVEDLENVYSLLMSKGCEANVILKDFNSLFEQHLINNLPMKGVTMQAIGASSIDDDYTTTLLILGLVDDILAAYRKYDTIVIQSFKNDPLFRETLDSALEKLFIANYSTKAQGNHDDSGVENLTGAFLMAKYCDFILMENKFERTANLTINRPDEELEASLMQIVFLVHQYLDDDELFSFQNWYWILLAKRLLRNPPSLVNYKAESLMINELYSVHEAEGLRYYAKKFRRMLADAQKSRYLTKKFKDYLINNKQSLLDTDFIVHLLIRHSSDEGIWPVRNEAHQLAVSLPTELKEILNHFNVISDPRYPKGFRRLTWSHELSTWEIVTNMFDKRYTLRVSVYQMAVLLQYNLQDSWTIQQLADSTRMKFPLLIHTLQTLVKAQLLLKSLDGDTDDLNESSTFVLSKDFRRSTTHISLIPLKFETQKEQRKKALDNLKNHELSNLLQLKILMLIVQSEVLLTTHSLSEVLQAKVKERLKKQCKYPPKVSTINTCIELLANRRRLMEELYSLYKMTA